MTDTPTTALRDELIAASAQPSREASRLRMRLATPASVVLEVLDVRGRRVATLARGDYDAGEHDIAGPAREISPGVYWCRLRIERAGSAPVEKRLRIVRLD